MPWNSPDKNTPRARNTRPILLAALLALLTLLAALPASADISGIICDTSENPLAGVSVAVIDSTGTGITTVTTDAAGLYTATLAPGFSGTLRPTLAGYYTVPAERTYAALQDTLTTEGYTCRKMPTRGILSYYEIKYNNINLASIYAPDNVVIDGQDIIITGGAQSDTLSIRKFTAPPLKSLTYPCPPIQNIQTDGGFVNLYTEADIMNLQMPSGILVKLTASGAYVKNITARQGVAIAMSCDTSFRSNLVRYSNLSQTSINLTQTSLKYASLSLAGVFLNSLNAPLQPFRNILVVSRRSNYVPGSLPYSLGGIGVVDSTDTMTTSLLGLAPQIIAREITTLNTFGAPIRLSVLKGAIGSLSTSPIRQKAGLSAWKLISGNTYIASLETNAPLASICISGDLRCDTLIADGGISTLSVANTKLGVQSIGGTLAGAMASPTAQIYTGILGPYTDISRVMLGNNPNAVFYVGATQGRVCTKTPGLGASTITLINPSLSSGVLNYLLTQGNSLSDLTVYMAKTTLYPKIVPPLQAIQMSLPNGRL